MNETEKTPGRRARGGSAWGRADLARRVARLPIPEESRARVARFVEDEIERAKAAWALESAPVADLECPECQKPIGAAVKKKLHEKEIVATLRQHGALDLSPEELEKLLEESKNAKAGS